MKKIVIAHLYPREMNIYGDQGNVITLKQRLAWRGFEPEVRSVEVGEQFSWDGVDVVFGGGGQDSGQVAVGKDLAKHGEVLRQMAADGVPMLVICGLYQLFGRGFTTMEGQVIPGIDVFRAETAGGRTRMIGNVVVESERFGRLVGFENHSGVTRLEAGQEALGRVKKGFGNDTERRHEGAVTGNVVGTYLHGPVLPKNPRLADGLLAAAVDRRYRVRELEPLDDAMEITAAGVAAGRPE